MLKAEYKYSLSLLTLIKLVLTTALLLSVLSFVDIVVPGFTISLILSDKDSVDGDLLALNVNMRVVFRVV